MRSNSRLYIFSLWVRGFLHSFPTTKSGLVWLGLFLYSVVWPTGEAFMRGAVFGFSAVFVLGFSIIATKIAYDFVKSRLWRKHLYIIMRDGLEVKRLRLTLPPEVKGIEAIQSQVKGQI